MRTIVCLTAYSTSTSGIAFDVGSEEGVVEAEPVFGSVYPLSFVDDGVVSGVVPESILPEDGVVVVVPEFSPPVYASDSEEGVGEVVPVFESVFSLSFVSESVFSFAVDSEDGVVEVVPVFESGFSYAKLLQVLVDPLTV